MADSLAKAQEQKADFNLKLAGDNTRAGLTCTLQSIRPNALELACRALPGPEWNKQKVEGFFHISMPEGLVFFAFNSRILNLSQNGDLATLQMSMPEHLRVEKKRHFVRVTPAANEIRMIAVWPMQPGKRLPRSNSDLGKPPLAWKTGQTPAAIQLENISAGGLALKFPLPEGDALPFAADKGRQMFCLLVYRLPDSDKDALFWCSGEIMSARKEKDALSLGLEFTNWALQEHGSTEIHWTHSSPWQGARPIIKWVEQLDRRKA